MTEKLHSCRVIALSQEDGVYALRFELHNRSETPVELDTYEPFTAFTVSAAVEGAPVTLHQPALDIPVRSIQLTVPAAGKLTIETPIRLRMARDAAPGNDGFVWTIQRDPDVVTLAIKLDLAAPFDQACEISFE